MATPIGNLGDITLRALAVLSAADLIACEDTRVTRRLLSAHGIPAEGRLVSYREANAAQAGERLLARLAAGASIALVSDAGSPLLADPGFDLVARARAAGLPVTSVPGPSALVAALQVAGLPIERVLFAGFLPAKPGARRSEIETLRAIPATLVFYEAPHRLLETLADLAAVLGEREAAVVRELTKHFEEVRRAPLPQLARDYAASGAPKGEIVVVVAPPEEREAELAGEALDVLLRRALGSMSLRDAASSVAAATGRPKREVYARALVLAGGEDAG